MLLLEYKPVRRHLREANLNHFFSTVRLQLAFLLKDGVYKTTIPKLTSEDTFHHLTCKAVNEDSYFLVTKIPVSACKQDMPLVEQVLGWQAFLLAYNYH